MVKGNNSKSRQTRVTHHVFCTSSHGQVLYICVKFPETISNCIRVMERTGNDEAKLDTLVLLT